MRILHLVAGASHGGAETFCLDALKALHEKGVEQRVLCRPHGNFVEALDSRQIPYVPLTYSRFRKWFEQRKIAREVREYRPDVVHCWMSRASSFMPSGINVPALGWFGGYYKLKNYRNCDFYMGVTKDIVRHIGKETGTPEKVFLVHTFGTLEEDPPVSRSDFGIPEDAKTVLLLSRMHWKKGVDTLLEAAKSLENVYLLLAGTGPDLTKYQELARTLGLEDRVRFLGWRTDRAALLGIADACVLPSRYEPFGTVIAEAWHAGVPLVATKADGARQYVTHGQDGLLSEIDDSDALAENLKAALFDESLRETLVANGRKTCESLFSKEVVVESLLRAYREMSSKTEHCFA